MILLASLPTYRARAVQTRKQKQSQATGDTHKDERTADQILEEVPTADSFENEKTADQILDELPPTKSAAEYIRAWNYFMEFRAARETTDNEPGEAIYVKYFDYLRNTKQYQASSLWTTYSKLNNNHQVSKPRVF